MGFNRLLHITNNEIHIEVNVSNFCLINDIIYSSLFSAG